MVYRLNVFLVVLFCIQFVSAGVFVSDILLNLMGANRAPMSWKMREIVEITAALGLVLGALFGIFLLRKSVALSRRTQSQLRVASGAFHELLEDHFVQWALSPAERDVALFTIKGMSIQEISDLRNTSEGTIKAQLNAIYRKSGTTNRTALLGVFVDALFDQPLITS